MPPVLVRIVYYLNTFLLALRKKVNGNRDTVKKNPNTQIIRDRVLFVYWGFQLEKKRKTQEEN